MTKPEPQKLDLSQLLQNLTNDAPDENLAGGTVIPGNHAEKPTESVELEPWIAFARDAACTWNIGHLNSEALALFSSEQQAGSYMAKVRADRIEQLKGRQLLSVLITAFKADIEHLALDPGETECRQVFSLREVLKSAKQHFEQQ